MAKLYAQFDGDEIDGKRYALGDEISDTVDAGTIDYLVANGRIGAAPPDMGKPVDVKPDDAEFDYERDDLGKLDIHKSSTSKNQLIVIAAYEKADIANADDANKGDLIKAIEVARAAK